MIYENIPQGSPAEGCYHSNGIRANNIHLFPAGFNNSRDGKREYPEDLDGFK